MLQKPDSSKKTSNTRFFHQVEALGRALAVEPNKSKPKPKPKPDSSSSSSSSSAWSWKNPLKSLSHIRHDRFECRFSLRVHSIVNLPPSLSASTLVVHWRRVSDSSPGSQTRPVRVLRGLAAFEETLTHTCSLYATKTGGGGGPHHQAKYESRHFLLYAALAGATGFDLGKHQVDLTRILPVTLEELRGEKVSGEWATTFRLSGKARGATLSVSFGYALLEPDGTDCNAAPEISGPKGTTSSILRRTASVTGTGFDARERGRALGEIIKRDRKLRQECSGLVDLKPEYESFSEPNDSPETKCCTSSMEKTGDEEPNFTVIVQGVEIPKGSEVDIDDLAKIREGEGSLSKNLSNLEFEGSQMSYDEVRTNYRAADIRSKSLNFDDIAESVTNEFLAMLGLEDGTPEVFSDPESPRATLWKEFEKESSSSDYGDFSMDFDLSSIVQAAEMELLEESSSSTAESKSKAQMLEDAETDALMQKWGMNKKVFENSSPDISNGFGSPIHLPHEELVELPSLGENLGPVVQTKDGGFLRSMSPSLFKNSKINGSLVMQSSNPVVVPAEMGSDVVEILRGLASIGIEKLSMQAKKLMPLEDITGRSMQQLAWEAAPELDTSERHDDDLLEYNLNGKSSVSLRTPDRIRKGECWNIDSSKNGKAGSEYVSLEDLAPLAMDKMEALSIEGLRIQSGLSDEEAPSNVNPRSLGEVSAFEGNGAKNWGSLGLEGAAGLKLSDVEDDGENVDGLMGLTITLDEWMRLDSGVVDEDDQISERTSKILAAHHAKSTEFLTADKRRGKRSGKRRGLLGNNFTVALIVQLRDPLRDYEPVGTPMLALIQVERVFVPPKPRIYGMVHEKGNDEQDNEMDIDPVPLMKGEIKVEEDAIPQFKITEVHVAGLKTDSGKQKLWGNSKQQQSGSRWLLANGMGKSNKNTFMKSTVTAKPSNMTPNVQAGDNLWSISSRALGNGAKWKGLAAKNHQTRNPNVNFPNGTIKLR